MAVDPSEMQPIPQRVSLITFAEEHGPLLIGLAVAVLVFLLYRHSQAANSTSAQTGGNQQDLSGLTTNAAGQPVVYVPTSTEFYTDNSVNATSAEGAPATIGPVNSPTSTTTTTTNPPNVIFPPRPPFPPPPPHPVSIISPAPRGSLKGTPRSAGNSDTNFHVYVVVPGDTLARVVQKAGWGNDTAKLVNYRNNAEILAGANIATGDPYAILPAGMHLSI